MKKFFAMLGRAVLVGIFVVVVGVGFVQPATAAIAQAVPSLAPFAQAVNVLPEVVTAFISGFFAFWLTQGVKAILAFTGVDVSGLAAAVTAFVVNLVVDFINGLLATQSPAIQDVIVQILVLLVSLVSMYGIHYTYRALKNPNAPRPFGLKAPQASQAPPKR